MTAAAAAAAKLTTFPPSHPDDGVEKFLQGEGVGKWELYKVYDEN